MPKHISSFLGCAFQFGVIKFISYAECSVVHPIISKLVGLSHSTLKSKEGNILTNHSWIVK